MKTLVIVKIGGNVLDDPEARESFLGDFAALPGPKLLVHGGGKIASEMGLKLGLKPTYHNGRRITDDATIELVSMVYGGLINGQLTARLQSLGCNAIGLRGSDANILPARKRPKTSVDFGWVGDLDPSKLDPFFLNTLLGMGLTPVIAPLTHDNQGNILNTNADAIVSTLATLLSPIYKVRLIYCFEKKGVLERPDDDASVLSELTQEDYSTMKANCSARGGMLPKLDSAFAAAAGGVDTVIIGAAEDLCKNVKKNGTCGTRIMLHN